MARWDGLRSRMFRWNRALLHGLIPLVLVVVAGLAVLFVAHSVDPEKAGKGVGQFACFAYFAGIGISYLAQTGRKQVALWTSVGLVGLVGLLLGLAISLAPKSLQASDREPLFEVQVAGKARLRHPTLGFSVLRPPPSYVSQPQLATMLGGFAGNDPSAVYYVYAETPPNGAVVIGVMANTGSSRNDFQDAIHGIHRGITTSAPMAQFLREEITGDDDHLIAHVHVVTDQAHVRIEAHAIQGRSPAIATVMVVDPDGTALTDVLESFAP
jgi:hypothetical protein